MELELPDGAVFVVDSLSPEPGFGFVTVRPHPAEGEPQTEVILPLGAFARLTLWPAEEPRERFGFRLPDA